MQRVKCKDDVPDGGPAANLKCTKCNNTEAVTMLSITLPIITLDTVLSVPQPIEPIAANSQTASADIDSNVIDTAPAPASELAVEASYGLAMDQGSVEVKPPLIQPRRPCQPTIPCGIGRRPF